MRTLRILKASEKIVSSSVCCAQTSTMAFAIGFVFPSSWSNVSYPARKLFAFSRSCPIAASVSSRFSIISSASFSERAAGGRCLLFVFSFWLSVSGIVLKKDPVVVYPPMFCVSMVSLLKIFLRSCYLYVSATCSGRGRGRPQLFRRMSGRADGRIFPVPGLV